MERLISADYIHIVFSRITGKLSGKRIKDKVEDIIMGRRTESGGGDCYK